MKQFAFIVLTSLLILSSFVGCSEDPNPVGADLLPRSDFVDIDTLTFVATKSFSQRVIPPLSSATRFLIGKFEDVESWGIIRFISLPDSLKGVKIQGADLLLRSNYHFGDSLGFFSFDIHQIQKTWWDSLTLDSINASGFYRLPALSSVSPGAIGDTASLPVPLDTALVNTWIAAGGDSTGLLLRPTNSRVVKGFATVSASDQSHRPKLVVRYERSGATKIDTAIILTSLERFAARVANDPWTSDSVRVQVRNGIAYRAVFQFNISAIPPKAAIHKAVLEVAIDRTLSKFNGFTVDSTQAFFIMSDGTITNGKINTSESIESNGTKIHRIQIARLVQDWVRGTTPTSIAVAGFDEVNAMDIFVLHGSAAPAALKPKLTIIYSPLQ